MKPGPAPLVYTIGHSNHPLEVFLGLLAMHSITAVVDVRTSPYSRFCPWFSQDFLKPELEKAGIRYLFFGPEFGARRSEQDCYVDGRVDFDLVRRATLFQQGIHRLYEGAQEFKIAMMCAEKDPIDCHRTILVARALSGEGFEVQHILADGSLESMESVTSRVMKAAKIEADNLFCSVSELQADAYRLIGKKVAWQDAEQNDAEQGATLGNG